MITQNTDLVNAVNENWLGPLIKPMVREIELFDSFVAGTTHLEDPSVLARIKTGDKLLLQREDNKFDQQAILILTGEKEIVKCPDVHLLKPLSRIDALIMKNDMLSFDGILEGIRENVLYKKCRVKGKGFLYSFRSFEKAREEEKIYLQHKDESMDFSGEDFYEERALFGVTVFESDLDLEPLTVYRCFDEKNILELVFKRCMDNGFFDNLDVSMYATGSRFIDIITSVITYRMLRKAIDSGLLEHMTFGGLMDELGMVWRRDDAPEEAATNDGFWMHTPSTTLEKLETLGLSRRP